MPQTLNPRLSVTATICSAPKASLREEIHAEPAQDIDRLDLRVYQGYMGLYWGNGKDVETTI